MPEFLSNVVYEWKLNQRFDHARYGLKPAHGIFAYLEKNAHNEIHFRAHPTVNDELPTRIASGTIRIKPNIKKFTETGIQFMDDSFVDNIDAVSSTIFFDL